MWDFLTSFVVRWMYISLNFLFIKRTWHDNVDLIKFGEKTVINYVGGQ
jgi:hypothetical protein